MEPEDQREPGGFLMQKKKCSWGSVVSPAQVRALGRAGFDSSFAFEPVPSALCALGFL